MQPPLGVGAVAGWGRGSVPGLGVPSPGGSGEDLGCWQLTAGPEGSHVPCWEQPGSLGEAWGLSCLARCSPQHQGREMLVLKQNLQIM